MPQVNCHNCNTDFDSNSLRCPHCNASQDDKPIAAPPEEKPTLVQCPDCGKSISRRSLQCIHCGGPNPYITSTGEEHNGQKSSADGKMAKIAFFLILMLTITIASVTFWLQGSHGEREAKELVLNILKSPTTAIFHEIEEVDGDTSIYRVTVSSENSFGAMIKNTFIVKWGSVYDSDGETLLGW